MKVLAVDDDVVARMAIRGMVATLGHDCALAGNGGEAWQLLQDGSFDVLITDRVMPDMNGLELCRRIRESGLPGGYLYVVLASALGEEEQARDGMLAGADDYLAKPLRLGQLELKLIAAERVTALHHRLFALNDDLRRRTEQELQTNRQLTESNRLQADMMAMLSHDARQPLAAVIGFVEATLEEWEQTPEEVKLANLNRSCDAARRLDQLIEDVLTMGNLDAGTITCRLQPVDVRQVVAEAISAAAGRTSVDVLGEQAFALVDPWHLKQVLTNLIGNATKYGTPPIAVTVRRGGQSRGAIRIGDHDVDVAGQNVEIEVSDGGEGVPEEFVPRLFDRFTRAETGIATVKQGTGFGLYIVRRLIEANGGQIGYRPAEPSGACFTVTLPVAAGRSSLPQQLPEQAPRPAIERQPQPQAQPQPQPPSEEPAAGKVPSAARSNPAG